MGVIKKAYKTVVRMADLSICITRV